MQKDRDNVAVARAEDVTLGRSSRTVQSDQQLMQLHRIEVRSADHLAPLTDGADGAGDDGTIGRRRCTEQTPAQCQVPGPHAVGQQAEVADEGSRGG